VNPFRERVQTHVGSAAKQGVRPAHNLDRLPEVVKGSVANQYQIRPAQVVKRDRAGGDPVILTP
jgi:hypothetical protein